MGWKTLFILAGLFLAPSPIMAAPIMVYGFHEESCGNWASYNETQRGWYVLWLKGVFTGHNFVSPSQQVVNLPDDESLTLYVDKYCRENPLGNLIAPAFQLTKELRPKKR